MRPSITPLRASYSIYIYEEGTPYYSKCNQYICGHYIARNWADNANPKPGRVRVEVRNAGGDIASNVVYASAPFRRYVFRPTLTFSSQTDSQGNIVHKAAAALGASDPSTYGTGYSIKLMRADGTQMCSAPQVGCNATVTVGGTYRTIVQNSGGHVAGQSAAWTLTGSGPVEEMSDGIDLVGLAGLLGASSVCDRVLVSPYGTHASGSSVSDQYLACEAAAAQGKGAIDLLKAIAAVGGSAGVLWWLQSDAQRTMPAPGSPTTDEDAEAPRPVPAPLSPAVDDLASELAKLNPGLAQDDADAIAHQCLFLAGRAGLNGRQRCAERRIFASGSDVAEATTHDLEALAEYPAWVALNYEQGSSKPGAGWKSCPGKLPGQQCDEYPFFSTEQGGPLAKPTPDLKAINATDRRDALPRDPDPARLGAPDHVAVQWSVLVGELAIERLLSTEQLDELERRWQEQGAPLIDRLRAGLEPDEIEDLMGPLGLTLPVEARTWWGWRDGVSVSDVNYSVERSIGGPDFEFLPLAEAVELYRQQRRLAANAAEAASVPEMSSSDYWWHPNWFPLTPSRYGGIVACDCRAAPDGPTPLRMIHWGGKEDFYDPTAGSMGTMVEWWLDALDRGAWRWDQSERRWLLDYSRLKNPSRELTRLV